jgi:hypothetical protein
VSGEVRSRPDEDRPAVPLLFAPYGGLPKKLLGAARDSGANAVWFHMFSEEQFEICGRGGLAPCVELKTFRADFAEHPELVPIGCDGHPIRYGSLVQGVCLSHPEFIDAIEESLIDGLRSYRPAGIWLDYLSYAGWFETPEPDLQESCFCPACIREFCESTGIDADSPETILRDPGEAWTRHKCERIAGFAKRFASIIRDRHPSCVVGAYLCPWRPDEHGGALRRIFAQDLDLLAPSIDVFTPLIYASKSGRSPAWSREYLEASPSFVPPASSVALILDVLDFPESLAAAATSSVPSRGIQIFGGSPIFADTRASRAFFEGVEMLRAALPPM